LPLIILTPLEGGAIAGIGGEGVLADARLLEFLAGFAFELADL